MDELPPLFAHGQRLGKYELLRRLAVGGMAEVYLATAVGPGDFRKVVAIKRLLPQHALDPQILRMFLDEARLMARLAHSNVTQVTDVDHGAGGDVPYFVMEYVHGTDLRGILNAAAGPLPIEQALAIAGAVAAGLHHAHELRGQNGQPLEIVHRDVSPSNILISFDGAVKITDFGVAKWSEQKSFTHQGQLKGKFAHMSPEQCRGEPLDRRSDVFALGTLLYEMTTGRPPFAAESEYELLKLIVSSDAPPPDRPGDGYPADLAAIVRRSLERVRDDRHPSTQHLQLELEAFARRHQLVVSAVSLATYVESLFGARVSEWREALASGKTLADHLEPAPATSRAGGSGVAAERTETDVYVGVRATAGGAVASPNTSTAGMASTGRRAWLTRTLAITGTAVLALAALFLATELTSRWQNVSAPSLPPVRTVESARAPAGLPTPASLPSPAGLPARPSSQQPASLPSRAAREREPDAPPAEIRRAPVVTRRHLDSSGASRAASPTGATATPTATQGEEDERRPSASVDQETPAREPPSAPAAPPPTLRAASPPAPPLKVWDPDSPVPP